MGMFATVYVDNSIELPHFPEKLDRDEMSWQSKQGLDVYGGPYRITADGRLEQKQTSYRDKTEEEKQAEAEKWGFDSWDEYTQVYEEHDVSEEGVGLIPEELDWDREEDGYEDAPPTIVPSEQTIDEEWWGDQSFHGTFEFHQAIKEDPIEYETLEGPAGTVERPSEYALDVFVAYEARFTKGELDEIILVSRHDDREEVIEQLEAYDDA